MRKRTSGAVDRENRERGAVLVEAALVLPILLMLILGIVDFGRAYSAKQALTHATREGVRVYAVTQDHSKAANAFWDGATSLDPTRVTAEIPEDDACKPGEPVEVSAEYEFDFVAPYFWPLGPLTIDSTAVMRCGG
jgi:Flp pilus assembly protein TadG